MWIRNLSKYIWPYKNPGDGDSFVESALMKNERVGFDSSVLLHKAVSTEKGADEYHLIPEIPITRVQEQCTKLEFLAKWSCVALEICLDWAYSPFKWGVNKQRAVERDSSQKRVMELFNGKILSDMLKREQLMKKAVIIHNDILSTAIDIFKKNNVEV